MRFTTLCLYKIYLFIFLNKKYKIYELLREFSLNWMKKALTFLICTFQGNY